MFKIFLQKRQRNAVGDLQAVKSCVVVCPENKDIFFFCVREQEEIDAPRRRTHTPAREK